MKIYAIEINNLSSDGMFCGQAVPRGCLNIVVDKIPEMIYQKTGNTYWAHSDGLVSAFQHSPGTTGGFADREITLPVMGLGVVFKSKGVTKVKFKGDLWDSGDASRTVMKELNCTIRSIGVKSGNDRGCYSSFQATSHLIEEIGKHVVLGIPVQRRDFKTPEVDDQEWT